MDVDVRKAWTKYKESNSLDVGKVELDDIEMAFYAALLWFFTQQDKQKTVKKKVKFVVDVMEEVSDYFADEKPPFDQ
jgi:hypothetical protein